MSGVKDLCKLVAFASPEAGVGRSVCAASIAISLAQRSRCLALDLDSQSRKLQTYLGLPFPKLGISELLEDRVTSLDSIRWRTGVPNLDGIGWSPSSGKSFEFGTRKIDALLKALQSSTAAYVISTLPAGMADDTIGLFAAADFPIVVTAPSPSALEKVVEFLSRCGSRRFEGRPVHVLVNRVQRGGEEKEAEAAMKAAGNNLGLNVSILGTVPYDLRLEATFRPGLRFSPQRSPGVAAIAFENIGFKIERLPAYTPAPRDAAQPAPTQPQQNDEAIRRLQEEHRAVVDELQEKIRSLEEVLRLRNQESPKEAGRTNGFEVTILVRQNEVEIARQHVGVNRVSPRTAVAKKRHVVPIVAASLVTLAILGAALLLGRRQEVQVRAPQTNTAPQLPSVPEAAVKIPAAVRVNSAVVQRVLPDVPQKARDTIRGTVRTSVRVATDPSGRVTQAAIDSRGPSQYFALLAREAAQSWKFTPASVNGRSVPSEWLLRFEFDNTETNVSVEQAAP
jgi:TonB family protein